MRLISVLTQTAQVRSGMLSMRMMLYVVTAKGDCVNGKCSCKRGFDGMDC